MQCLKSIERFPQKQFQKRIFFSVTGIIGENTKIIFLDKKMTRVRESVMKI